MRVSLSLGLVLVAVGLVSGEGFFGFHEKYGIPAAAKIKSVEEEIITKSPSRIVGGVTAPINAHPYLGGLVISFVNVAGQSACGSTLVSSTRLVTAAHCWFDGQNQARSFEVVLGSHYLFSGGTRIVTSSVYMHPQWTPIYLTNDVAMIYLPRSVFFSNAIQPAALPTGSMLNENFVGSWATAAGYGKTSDSQLGISTGAYVSHVTLQVLTWEYCASIYDPLYVKPSNICTSGAGGVGICGGDSGGPLVINRNGQNYLVGISSFVATLPNVQSACQRGYPSAFARVNSFYNFIVSHM